MVCWLHCNGSAVRQNVMVVEMWQRMCSLYGIQEAETTKSEPVLVSFLLLFFCIQLTHSIAELTRKAGTGSTQSPSILH
jgi:hypothetical protein